MERIERLTVPLYGRKYLLFRFVACPGTPKERIVTVAEYKLNAIIEKRIRQDRYHEVRGIDEIYEYYLPKDIDTNSDREIRESIEDIFESTIYAN